MPVWAISGLSFSILYPTLVMSIRLYFPAQQVSGAAGTILSIASLADILFNVGFGKSGGYGGLCRQHPGPPAVRAGIFHRVYAVYEIRKPRRN
ncbi:MAG: hypothetical protein ACLRYE_03145 [Gemmiger formicilis]|uniref:hypothetical protein n=1 Tax=Gemmiger formicilis TaxID=745368 RepID=UPI0039A118B2